MAHDAHGAHARDKIGISETISAKPLQAALSSATTFVIGAALPLLVAWAFPGAKLIPIVAVRVTFSGALAMLLSAVVGRIFGVVA